MEFQSFDEEYVRRLVQGDSSVADHFTGYFGGLLKLKLRCRLRVQEDVEDVLQETLARVWKALRQQRLEHPMRLGAFVNGVCNNVLLEKYHEHTKHPGVKEKGPDIVDPRSGQYAYLVTKELKRLVEQVLVELSDKDRQLLRMVFLEEEDKAEVCKQFDLDPAYLRVLLHRAKKRLRKKLIELGKNGDAKAYIGRKYTTP